MSDAYAGAVPADLVLACGVFGNVPDADVEATVRLLPRLCAPGATVVWTRDPGQPTIIGPIEGWLREAGFATEPFVMPDDRGFGAGPARLTGDPFPFEPGRLLFRFVR